MVGGIIAGFTGDRLISGWLDSSQLHIIASPNNVSVGKPVNVMFITFGNGESVGNANITLDGAAFTSGVTDTNGMVSLTVNATTSGSINVTAQKSGYYNATDSMIATPDLVINANPTSITSNTPSYVTFSVSSMGKPVNGAYLNLTGAGISLDGITNVNGGLVLQLNAPSTGSIVVKAKKPDYSDSSMNISSTSQPTLSVSSSLSAVTINAPTYVTFSVTAGGSPVKDAFVSLIGTASGSGITNQEGKAIILVTSSGVGTITASVNRIGFTGGSIAITSTGVQALSVAANPTSVTAGVPAYVTFTVTSAGSALIGATVSVSGGGISTDGVTNSAGQAILLLNAGTSGTISVTARKAGYVDGLTTIAH